MAHIIKSVLCILFVITSEVIRGGGRKELNKKYMSLSLSVHVILFKTISKSTVFKRL